MKLYLTAHMRCTALVLAAIISMAGLATTPSLMGQSTNEKVRLMADTLRARDSGNLEEAKVKAEELIKIAPGDENVQRLLASINRELDSRAAASTGGTSPEVEPVYGQSPDMPVESAMEAGPEVSETEGVIAAAASEQEARIEAAEAALDDAWQLAGLGAFGEARTLLSSAAGSLSLNSATADTLEAIEKAEGELILMEAKSVADGGDLRRAEALVESYLAAGGSPRRASALARRLDKEISDPYELEMQEISPEYIEQQKTVRDLLARGRAQFLNGDYEGAQATFQEVEARDANNSDAKLFQTRIAMVLGDTHEQNHYKTRQQMLTEVDQAWERPKVFDVTTADTRTTVDDGLQEKLNSIVIPQVKFSGMELTRVIETLSELSAVHDPEQTGVNIIPIFNSNDNNPRVSITLNNLNLDRILQFVTQQVGFSYDVGSDAVTVQPSDSLDGVGGGTTITEAFPISQATVLKFTGFNRSRSTSGAVDPFSAPAPSGGGGGNEEEEKIKSFLQRAGVNFDIPGADLAYDGAQIYVTQTRRNLERVRNIMLENEVAVQVEIEAKFLEVAQNDLEELGFDWSVTDPGVGLFDPTRPGGVPLTDPNTGERIFDTPRSGQFSGRTLNDGFSTDSSTASINITGFDPISVRPPTLSSAIDLASDAGTVFNATGWTALGLDVEMAIRALSRKTGTDLMSAPKVTVLSGVTASITVAQELRYPTRYGEIRSETPRGGNNNDTGNSSNSISITAGTPEDFVTRNVGVELEVTPKVEEGNIINLELSPSVTEFEGFVEYGGPSVAISGTPATVVTVPAGFYQPVFSTREISTTVNVRDGATLVMGGLTRDEIKTVNDKVPVLGDIPGVGRLFRSEGETRQKRNLLIFVTANLVSPGGSPARQNYRNLDANSLFQNPTIMTPSGSVNRGISEEPE